jgi:hypothetical protein
MPSALLIHDVPIECINHAAIIYHVPATLIVSVLVTEGGRIGTVKLNKNGTHDYGPMQINTIWFNRIKQYGYNKDDILYNPCANVEVGAWILSQRIASTKDLWYGIGSYNSYSLPQNSRYQNKVSQVYYPLRQYLSYPLARR